MNTPEAIVAQFPTRPLNISRAIAMNPIWAMLIGIVVCLLALLIPYLGAPGLLNDYEISKNPMEVNAGIDGKCRSKLMFTNCDVTLTYQGEKVERNFSFFDIKGGDYYVTAITSKDKPALLTVDLATDKIMNRLITQIVFFVLILAGGISAIRAALRGKKMNQLLANINGKKLIPVLVPVTIKSIQGVTVANYYWPINQSSQKYFATFKEKTEGSVLEVSTEDAAKTYALGVTTDHQAVPILLDETLSRIDLTADEKAQLLECIYS